MHVRQEDSAIYCVVWKVHESLKNGDHHAILHAQQTVYLTFKIVEGNADIIFVEHRFSISIGAGPSNTLDLRLTELCTLFVLR